MLDFDRLADGSTLADPLQYVEGVDEVLVNGTSGRLGGRAHRGTPGHAPRRDVSELIDLRSDYLRAGPTDEMWEAMRAAELGWATYGEDENVNELERRGAELLGKEAAVFVPTCTLANLAAVLALTRRGGRAALSPTGARPRQRGRLADRDRGPDARRARRGRVGRR